MVHVHKDFFYSWELHEVLKGDIAIAKVSINCFRQSGLNLFKFLYLLNNDYVAENTFTNMTKNYFLIV